MTNEVKDFLGYPITVGATVAYPVRRGADMWMNAYRVLQVDPEPQRITCQNDDGRMVFIKRVDRVVVTAGSKN